MRLLLLLVAAVSLGACARPRVPLRNGAPLPEAATCVRPATLSIGDARLGELRSQIDCVDAALARLSGERLEIARRIGAVKREMGAPVVDTVREAVVVARFAQRAEAEGLDARTATTIIRALILAARAEQQAALPSKRRP